MRSGCCIAVLLALTPAAADEPKSIDLAAETQPLTFLEDSQGHLLILGDPGPKKPLVFFGNRRGVYRQQTMGNRYSESKGRRIPFWDPRVHPTLIELHQERVSIRCGDRVTRFTALPADRVAKLRPRLEAKERLWNRRAYFLARDDWAQYYFVDKIGGDMTDFRVYRGGRGRMKRVKLHDIAIDSAGLVFAGKNGSLRLEANRGRVLQATWVTRKEQTKLTLLPVEANMKVIYNELGVYFGARLGTPCDDL